MEEIQLGFLFFFENEKPYQSSFINSGNMK